MAAAQTKGHEEDKHTGMHGKYISERKKRKTKNEKQKARHKSKKIVLKASP